MTDTATVFLIDDDESLRDALVWLLESVDLAVEPYSSAIEFLESFDANRSGCIVLDVRMPGISGLALQKQLRQQKVELPVVVITGHGDVPMCVEAFQNGAYSFFEKPINNQQFLDTIHGAIALDAERRHGQSTDFSQKLNALSPRECEVLRLIGAGYSMKEIAGQLDISVQTCSKHRARVLEKMKVANDVQLVRLLLANDSRDLSGR